jgi:hypothetical protein
MRLLEKNLSMDNYIRVYENVLNKNICDSVMEKFEKNKDQQEVVKDEGMSFTQIDFGKHDGWGFENKIIFNTLMQCVGQYANDCKIKQVWPKKHGYESVRIKRYLPDGKDEFSEHVDVMDYATAKRFLVIFLYLNDNDEGQTIFPGQDFTSQCKQGNVLIFPPLWPWQHAGRKPIETPKYIVGSYLHYT